MHTDRFNRRTMIHYLKSARMGADPIATLNALPIGILSIEDGIRSLDPFQRPELDRRYTRAFATSKAHTHGIAMILRLNGF